VIAALKRLFRHAGRLRAPLAALALAAPCAPAGAHALGQGYVFLDIGTQSLTGWVEVTLIDLDRALAIDDNRDGKVEAAEADAHLDRIKGYLHQRLGLRAQGRPIALRFTTHQYRRIPVGQYLALSFEAEVRAPLPGAYAIHYSVLFDADPQHRGFLVVHTNTLTGDVNSGEETSLVFTPERQDQVLDLAALSPWSSFTAFVGHGVWHILIGLDHVLFLLALLLPSVLERTKQGWRPLSALRPAALNLLTIITLFTVAHTLTLTLASLGVVTLPGRLVESVIALSVIAAAVNNVYPVLGHRVGWVVFGFGLFHGFGFAGVLQHLMRSPANRVINLLGFNVGVEIGQLLIAAAVFPLLFALRGTRAYGRVLVPLGSGAIACLALAWFAERALDVDLVPF